MYSYDMNTFLLFLHFFPKKYIEINTKKCFEGKKEINLFLEKEFR